MRVLEMAEKKSKEPASASNPVRSYIIDRMDSQKKQENREREILKEKLEKITKGKSIVIENRAR